GSSLRQPDHPLFDPIGDLAGRDALFHAPLQVALGGASDAGAWPRNGYQNEVVASWGHDSEDGFALGNARDKMPWAAQLPVAALLQKQVYRSLHDEPRPWRVAHHEEPLGDRFKIVVGRCRFYCRSHRD